MTDCLLIRSNLTYAGIAYGTLPHRIDNTLLRFLPRREMGCMLRGAHFALVGTSMA